MLLNCFMDTKELKKIIKRISDFTVLELKEKGLISLYLSGTILTKDRTPQSDIDIFGIVTSNFDIIEEENKINKKFEENGKELCGGIETRFRGIGIDELEGGKPRGVLAKYVGLEVLIKKFPFFKKLWGEDIDFSKFPIKPLKAREEAKKEIGTIEKFLEKLKKGEELFPIQNFPKSILYLARIEAEHDYGFQFDPSYKKLTRHLQKERNHIVHKAMQLREKKVTKDDILQISKEVEAYIKHIRKRMKEWN